MRGLGRPDTRDARSAPWRSRCNVAPPGYRLRGRQPSAAHRAVVRWTDTEDRGFHEPQWTGKDMWEIERYDWKQYEAYGDAARAPEWLRALLLSQDDSEWSQALISLESCASDLGVPCSMTPAVVSCLVSIALRVEGKKRSAILSSLEELTCGRGAEQYSDQQLG